MNFGTFESVFHLQICCTETSFEIFFSKINCFFSGSVKVWDPRQKNKPVAVMECVNNEEKRDCWCVCFGNYIFTPCFTFFDCIVLFKKPLYANIKHPPRFIWYLLLFFILILKIDFVGI